MPKPAKRLGSCVKCTTCRKRIQSDPNHAQIKMFTLCQKNNVLHVTRQLPGSRDDCHHSNLPCWGTSCVPHSCLQDQSPCPRNSRCSYQHCNSKLCLLCRWHNHKAQRVQDLVEWVQDSVEGVDQEELGHL